jgi:hypothetical protein
VSNVFEGPGATNVSVTEDSQRWPCQVVGVRWVDGTGFVFDYCPEAQRFLASWQMRGRWRSAQHLRICDAHARELLARHAVTPPPAVVPVVAPAPAVDDDPFGDVDAPYARTRGRS